MTVANYSDLQAAVARWLRRTDLTADIPDFITLAEAQMNRRIRSRRKIIRAQTSLTGEFLAVPGDFSGVRAFKLATSVPSTLGYISPEMMAELKGNRTSLSGTPSYYSIVGGEFEFDAVVSGPVAAEISYYQTIPALSIGAPTNWVLASHPDAYLYGALTQSAPFLKADDRMATWGTLFSTAVNDINAMSMAESIGGALSPSPSGSVV